MKEKVSYYLSFIKYYVFKSGTLRMNMRSHNKSTTVAPHSAHAHSLLQLICKMNTQLYKTNKYSGKKIGLLLFFVLLVSWSFAQYPLQVTTNIVGSTSPTPDINNYILGANIRCFFSNSGNQSYGNFNIYGKIQRITPAPFTISLNPEVSRVLRATIAPGAIIPLTTTSEKSALGDFFPQNLVSQGVSFDTITNAATGLIELPNGTYRICFYADIDSSGSGTKFPISDPNLGCTAGFFTVATCSQPENGMQVTTSFAAPSFSPNIQQIISTGGVSSTIQYNNPPGCNANVKLYGKIERLAPTPFTIELNPNDEQINSIPVAAGTTKISAPQMVAAFGNFSSDQLVATGIDLAVIRDANNNIRLPDGNYRICFYGRYVNFSGEGTGIGANASNPNLGCANFTVACSPTNAVQINTTVKQPVNPVVSLSMDAALITSSAQFTAPPGCNNVQVKLFGRIESISSPSFSISVNPQYTQQLSISLVPGATTQLNTAQLKDAFANFDPNNLVVTGMDPASIRDPLGRIRLPDGNYRICFYARYVSSSDDANPLGGNASNPSLGCANFTIACSPTNAVQINTIIKPPVNPVVSQSMDAGLITSSAQFNVPTDCNSAQVKLFGRIQGTSSPSFSISLNPDYNQQQPVTLVPGTNTQLNATQLKDAFANFDPASLIITGVDPASIRDANGRIRLPDGAYQICFYARYFNPTTNVLGGNASNQALGCGSFNINCQPPNGVQITTIVKTPINSILSQAIAAGSFMPTVQITNQPLCNTQVKFFGRIERIAPSPFTITLNPDYQQQAPVTLTPGLPTQLTAIQQRDAFGNYNPSNLIVEGIDPAQLRNATGQIKLPGGNYRICFYARYLTASGALDANASNPISGCGIFNLCNQAGGAPQFTQPVNNLNINDDIQVVQPASPVVFTWAATQSICGVPTGGVTYDFEIRELYNNQTVSDAVNNPFVFRKASLPSTTFLLDTNLYKRVLQEGKKYAIRVRAVSVGPNPVEIENNGYSRIEAFQYGRNIQNGRKVITQKAVTEPIDYLIPLKERKKEKWDQVYTAYAKRAARDTLVPIEEYIDFTLAQNGIGYNLSAIELFLGLNPPLRELTKVKLNYNPRLPVLPKVTAADQQIFDKEYQASQQPDDLEKNKFLRYVDTIVNHKQAFPDNASGIITSLTGYLNTIKTQIVDVDQVSVNYINMVLSEFLYETRLYPKGMNKGQLNQLQELLSTIMDLTAPSPDKATFFHSSPDHSSLSSVEPNTIHELTSKMSIENYVAIYSEEMPGKSFNSISKQLLPFDVIVYRNSGVTPYNPVMEAPDLNAAYRVFYTLSVTYNHKTPEINAKNTSRLASTVQVSLPANATFKFWTLNMLNHKITRPEDVDLKRVLNDASKNAQSKKPSIMLKVD